MRLEFLNHASFLIETNQSILICDIWLEGNAFDNGWALLDRSISNQEYIDYLTSSKKNIFLWYSHEHSDHLSFSFLRNLQKTRTNFTVLFQETADKRVFNFLKKFKINVIEQPDDKVFLIDSKLSIITWKFNLGDSFCLILANDIKILNTNDCVINSTTLAKDVFKKINNHSNYIDIHFTQFGYANKVGNKEDISLRKEAAIEKLHRIKIQTEVFKPIKLIPFASFCFFCHEENFYMNDGQNSPMKIRHSQILKEIQNKISFMKPFSNINLLNKDIVFNDLEKQSIEAEDFWEKKIKSIKITTRTNRNDSLSDLYENNSNPIKEFHSYRRKSIIILGFLPQVLEIIRYIKPVKILIKDSNLVLKVSWLNGIKLFNASEDYDMSCTKEVAIFMFKNDYGFSTVNINARYELNPNSNWDKIPRFFLPQVLISNGYTFQNPLLLLKLIIKFLKKKIKNKMFK